MKDLRRSSHTVSRLTVHIVFVTKYRYHVLEGEVKRRSRDLIRQTLEAMDIIILSGVVSKDHVHLHIEYPPKLSISDIMKKVKGRSSRILQKEFTHLKKRYWGRRFWAKGYGCWSTGNITDDMVAKYLEHHRKPEDLGDDNFILE